MCSLRHVEKKCSYFIHELSMQNKMLGGGVYSWNIHVSAILPYEDTVYEKMDFKIVA